jgi:hypothetical protein
MTTLVMLIMLVSQFFQWIILIKHRRDNTIIWYQIKEMANNIAKQLVLLRIKLDNVQKRKGV